MSAGSQMSARKQPGYSLSLRNSLCGRSPSRRFLSKFQNSLQIFQPSSYNHQEFQVPKMEVLNLIRAFWGWVLWMSGDTSRPSFILWIVFKNDDPNHSKSKLLSDCKAVIKLKASDAYVNPWKQTFWDNQLEYIINIRNQMYILHNFARYIFNIYVQLDELAT